MFSSYCRQLKASPRRLDRAQHAVLSVCILDELLPPSPAHAAAPWNSHVHSGSLEAPLGIQATGTLVLDLAMDGPHLLIAGTTGSGKSELLRSLVLALALTDPPDQTHSFVVDFNGGAGLGPWPVWSTTSAS